MRGVSQQNQAELADRPSREFLLLQFRALRDEIIGKTERVVRIQLAGVTAIPLVIGAGERYGVLIVLAASPIVTIVFSFILLYEQNGIMRAGRYVRLHLEPFLIDERLIGWEEWLERYPVNRRAETFFALSAYIAFSLYYLGGSYLAYLALKMSFGSQIAVVFAAAYAGGFLLALYVVVTNFAVTTRGQEEQRDDRARPRPLP
jgi:hypothetical protein